MATKRKCPDGGETSSSCGAGASAACVNGCGFFGSAVTKNMCSKCFEEHVLASAIAEYSGVVATKKAAATATTTREQTPFFAFAKKPRMSADVDKKTPFLAFPTPEKKTTMMMSSVAAVASPSLPATGEKTSAAVTDANKKQTPFFALPTPEKKKTTMMMMSSVAAVAETPSSLPATAANRCARCRRKVGLSTAFKCRCGGIFCGGHRHYETHSCSFDYKRAGREQIKRQNPLVVADKMLFRI